MAGFSGSAFGAGKRYTDEQVKSCAAAKTNKIEITCPIEEGLNGNEQYQNEINKELIERYKNIFKDTSYENLDIITDETKILKRIYMQTTDTTSRKKGFYIYDFLLHKWILFGDKDISNIEVSNFKDGVVLSKNDELVDDDSKLISSAKAKQEIDNLKENLSTYRGSFDTKALLDAYSETKENNDYAIVKNDETHDNECSRYIYVSNSSSWVYQYKVNDAPLTQAQLDAINSGINNTKRTNYDNHIVDTDNPHEVNKEQVGLGNVDNKSEKEIKTDFTGSIAENNDNFAKGGDVYSALGNKVDKVSGKSLISDTDIIQIGTNKTDIANLKSGKQDILLPDTTKGINIINKVPQIVKASDSDIAEKTNQYNPITPSAIPILSTILGAEIGETWDAGTYDSSGNFIVGLKLADGSFYLQIIPKIGIAVFSFNNTKHNIAGSGSATIKLDSVLFRSRLDATKLKNFTVKGKMSSQYGNIVFGNGTTWYNAQIYIGTSSTFYVYNRSSTSTLNLNLRGGATFSVDCTEA